MVHNEKQLPTVHIPYIPPEPSSSPTPVVKKRKHKRKKKRKQIPTIQSMEARRLDQYPIDLTLEIFDPYFLPQVIPEYQPIEIIDLQEEPYQEEPYQEEPYQEEPYQEDNILTPQHTDNIIVRLWIKEYELTQSTIRKTRLLELIQSGRSIKKQQLFISKIK
jgi:hypothetical protein